MTVAGEVRSARLSDLVRYVFVRLVWLGGFPRSPCPLAASGGWMRLFSAIVGVAGLVSFAH
jgi:hypothetical protein